MLSCKGNWGSILTMNWQRNRIWIFRKPISACFWLTNFILTFINLSSQLKKQVSFVILGLLCLVFNINWWSSLWRYVEKSTVYLIWFMYLFRNFHVFGLLVPIYRIIIIYVCHFFSHLSQLILNVFVSNLGWYCRTIRLLILFIFLNLLTKVLSDWIIHCGILEFETALLSEILNYDWGLEISYYWTKIIRLTIFHETLRFHCL